MVEQTNETDWAIKHIDILESNPHMIEAYMDASTRLIPIELKRI